MEQRVQGGAGGVACHKKQTSKAILLSAVTEVSQEGGGGGEWGGKQILSGFAIFHFLATKPEDASKVRERETERESNDR